MLLTLTISETETQAWATSPATRAAAKIEAFRRAFRLGRRFYQVQSATGRVLFVGEVDLTRAAA